MTPTEQEIPLTDAAVVSTFRRPSEIFEGLNNGPEHACTYCATPCVHEFPVCDNHRQCTQCAKLLSPEDINICVRNDSEPMHASCALVYAQRENLLEDKTQVTISRKHFEHLNRIRLFMEVNPILTEQTNRDVAIREMHNIVYNHKLNHDDIYLLLVKLEAAAGALHTILGKNKETIRIKARDKQQVLSSRATEEAKAEKKAIKRAEKSQRETVKLSRDTKLMTPEEKTLFKVMGTYMKLGLDENEAREEAMKFLSKKRS